MGKIALATLSLSIGGGTAFFVLQKLQLKAIKHSPYAFVSFVESFEDLQKTSYRDNFGWGGGETLHAAVRDLAPSLHNCRQYKREGEGSFRFDVKVTPKFRRFRVVGIIDGAEENSQMAQCLRNKINDTNAPRLASLNDAPESSYRLRIEVQHSVAVESY